MIQAAGMAARIEDPIQDPDKRSGSLPSLKPYPYCNGIVNTFYDNTLSIQQVKSNKISDSIKNFDERNGFNLTINYKR